MICPMCHGSHAIEACPRWRVRLAAECRVNLGLRLPICSTSVLRGCKYTKVLLPLVDCYDCLKAFSMWANAAQLQFAIRLREGLILVVQRVRNGAQVAYSVVRLAPVDVVNFTRRPFAINVQPRQTVRKEARPINADVDVSIRCVESPGDRSSCSPAPSSFVGEVSRIGVVVKNFAQTLRGKIGLSHDAPIMLIGQRPVSVSSTCGLRYFSVGKMWRRGSI